MLTGDSKARGVNVSVSCCLRLQSACELFRVYHTSRPNVLGSAPAPCVTLKRISGTDKGWVDMYSGGLVELAFAKLIYMHFHRIYMSFYAVLMTQ